MEKLVVNGKYYPLWSQFIEKKLEWVGADLFDYDMGLHAQTKIKDIELRANGKDSAYFEVVGEDFSCGFDVQHGGVGGQSKTGKGISFCGYGGHQWEISK